MIKRYAFYRISFFFYTMHLSIFSDRICDTKFNKRYMTCLESTFDLHMLCTIHEKVRITNNDTSHNSYKEYKTNSWTNTGLCIYDKWDQVTRRSKHSRRAATASLIS